MTLTAENIAVSLGGRQVLDGAGLTVAPGEMLGLCGPNGAGKSTLLRALLGLVPSNGSITLDGQAVADLDPTTRARKIAYAPQSAPVHWPMTAERVVMLARLPHLGPFERPGSRDIAAVDAALKATDADHLRHRLVTELSGGERAAVMLARAIAVEAPYLLADEPVAALDPWHRLKIMEVLKERAEAGHGVVVVLHDLGLASRYCNRIVLLDMGRVFAAGSPEVVLTDAALAAVYRVTVTRADGAIVPSGRL